MARSTATRTARKAAHTSKPVAVKATPKAPAKRVPKAIADARARYSIAQARTMVTEAVEAVRLHEVEGMGVTERAARATYAAYTTGLIGGPGAVYTGETFAALFGSRSKSLVTRWRGLGVALEEKGIDPTSALWTDLLKGNKVDGVRGEIMRDGSTKASITAALKSTYLPDGSKRNPTKGKANPDGKGKAATSAEAKGLTPHARVLLALKVLRSDLPAIDREQWSKVETAMTALVTRENLTRAKGDTTAARRASKGTTGPVSVAS